MDERAAVAWLLRRGGFGAGPGELDAAVANGVEGTLDRLVEPDRFGVPQATDLWDDALFADAEPSRELAGAAIDGWLERMRTTPRPLEERVAWVWHDHFATSLAKVRHPGLLVLQVRTLERLGLGSFRELLRAMTVDGAMLVWLDGVTNTRQAPNENHARELFELFAVGVDAHTEADVQAAAKALTGWVVDRSTGQGVFRPRRHDDSRQVVLGVSGVHDVDGIVDAACASAACAPYVTGCLARHLLGPAAVADDTVVGDLAADFRQSGLQIGPLVRALLRAGLDRDDTSVVEAPVPWLVRAERATGARLPARARLGALRGMGQLPMVPPDVGGWPDHTAWLAAGTVLARASSARAVAAASDSDGPARDAAARGDWTALADALGRPEGFDASTLAALGMVRGAVDRLALALTAPGSVVV